VKPMSGRREIDKRKWAEVVAGGGEPATGNLPPAEFGNRSGPAEQPLTARIMLL
jgi:hypothetical protein